MLVERSNHLSVVVINNSGMLLSEKIEVEIDKWQRLRILQN